MIITLDTGTTNTRIKLFNNTQLVDETMFQAGIRDNILSGNCKNVSDSIKKNLNIFLEKNNLTEKDIEVILAAGMLGSNSGLYKIDYVKTPANANKLKESSKLVNLFDITNIPFLFIPGVINDTDSSLEQLSHVDMMRGEEVEILGMIESLKIDSSFLAVLPGSHNKLVEVNSNMEIANCTTTLGGELIDAISKNTTLKSSLELLYDDVDDEFLLSGCKYCLENGFNVTMFKIRVLEVVFNQDKFKICSFFIGALLANDVNQISKIHKNRKIIIGGKNPLRQSLAVLLKKIYDIDSMQLSDSDSKMVSSLGAIKVYNTLI